MMDGRRSHVRTSDDVERAFGSDAGGAERPHMLRSGGRIRASDISETTAYVDSRADALNERELKRKGDGRSLRSGGRIRVSDTSEVTADDEILAGGLDGGPGFCDGAGSGELEAPTVVRRRGRSRPAVGLEARENQLISLAVDLVEQRLRDGSATSQEVTHFLKLATSKSRLETEILKCQKELITAKTESIRSASRVEELYSEAINALKRYGGGAASGSAASEDDVNDYG